MSCVNFLKQGSKVTLSGNLSSKEWTDPNTGEIKVISQIQFASILDYHLSQNQASIDGESMVVAAQKGTNKQTTTRLVNATKVSSGSRKKVST